MKKIIHVDMDAFYAAVEQRENPSLRGKPVIIAGEASKRGVVATCSYEARAFGVYSGMPTSQAKNRCSHGVFLPPNLPLYKRISQELQEIFLAYTPLVEPLALDEAYLDVTENLLQEKNSLKLAKAIKQEIWERLALIASVGISYNKFLAKVASEKYKPNGLGVIRPQDAKEILEQLSIEDFFGVGRVTAYKMQKLGISFGKDLKEKELSYLKQHFGKMGESFYYLVRGHDFRSVNPHRVRKSLGKEVTFAFDIDDEHLLVNKLYQLSQDLLEEMEKKKVSGRTLTLKIKAKDFQSFSKSYTVLYPLRGQQDLFSLAKELFFSLYVKGRALRLIGLSISKLLKRDEEGSMGNQLMFSFKEFASV